MFYVKDFYFEDSKRKIVKASCLESFTTATTLTTLASIRACYQGKERDALNQAISSLEEKLHSQEAEATRNDPSVKAAREASGEI